jgi:hypothetical protein
MKTTLWTSALLIISALAFASCGKQEEAPGPVPVYNGVKMNNLPKLDTDFTNATPEVQASIVSIKEAFRYAAGPQALMGLAKLSENSTLTEPQKKVLAGLIEETKQMVAKSQLPPGQ